MHRRTLSKRWILLGPWCSWWMGYVPMIAELSLVHFKAWSFWLHWCWKRLEKSFQGWRRVQCGSLYSRRYVVKKFWKRKRTRLFGSRYLIAPFPILMGKIGTKASLGSGRLTNFRWIISMLGRKFHLLLRLFLWYMCGYRWTASTFKINHVLLGDMPFPIMGCRYLLTE